MIKINNRHIKLPLPDFNYGSCWLCGGAVRDSLLGLNPDDYDIFALQKYHLETFILDNLKEAKQVFDSENLKTFIWNDKKVQLIYREYPTFESILESFDFTICKFAYNGELWADSDAIFDLFEKKLVTNSLSPDFIANSLERAFKYQRKGFSPCSGTIETLIKSIRSATDSQIENNFAFYPNGKTRIRTFD